MARLARRVRHRTPSSKAARRSITLPLRCFQREQSREKDVSEASLANNGERMIVGNAWGYWAHLSIYHFAIPFAVGKRILDAGSGAGYGAAYLARNGAAGVLALDASADAIMHSRERYAGDAVTFEVADLNTPLPLGSRTFGLVFSSNVFEHVGNVDGLAAECARLIAADGVLIVAVPPITSRESMTSDMGNQFHVHHVPPVAWQAKLSRFFHDVQCHGHFGKGEFAAKERARAEIEAPPDRVIIRETDFEFPATNAEAMDGSITAVFVCRRPRDKFLPAALAERTPAEWRAGEAAASLIAAERARVLELQAQVSFARDEIASVREKFHAATTRASTAEAVAANLSIRVAALESSTSWRLTGPLRAVMRALRR
jgi:2-polyprenyl-3-methyl-5-hydroxy-6-metoxy-1,4-benzoquinol methylase